MRWRAVGLTFLLPAILAAQSGTIRVNTRLVQVDVVVRDKNGPVADLTPADFTIYDNGKPQQIAVFSVSAPKDFTPADNPPALPPGVVSNRENFAGEPPASSTVVLFDLMNSLPAYHDYAKRQLLAYVRSIQKGERIAIYVLDSKVRMAQDFTGDADRLSRAAESITTTFVPGVDTGTIGNYGSAMRGIGADFTNWVAKVFAMNQADWTAIALESIARHLGGQPGRKNLVWISTGFPLSPEILTEGDEGDKQRIKESPSDSLSQVNRSARALNDANIAIYPVDVRGIPAPVPDVAMRLANATGGKAAFFTNDIRGAVRDAVADGKVSYTLGFYSSEEDYDRSFHKLSVKVDRKGVEVRHRSGFFAASNPATTDAERKRILAGLMISPLDASEIGLTASAAADPAHPGSYLVKLRVDPIDLRLDQQNEFRVGQLKLAMRLESSRSSTFESSNLPLRLSEDQFRAALRSSLVIDQSVQSPGSDRLRIVVQDEATGHAGSLWLPLGK